MKAVIQHEFGDANVLTYTDVAVPKLGENEVLIKVAYTSVNYADLSSHKQREGTFQKYSITFERSFLTIIFYDSQLNVLYHVLHARQ